MSEVMRNSMVTMTAPARKFGSSECRLLSRQASTSSVAHLDIGEADPHVARHQAAAGIVADDLGGWLRAWRAGLSLRTVQVFAVGTLPALSAGSTAAAFRASSI